MRHAHQRLNVADRADIDLAAGQEGDGAVQVDDEAALDAAEDHAVDALALLEGLFQADPGFFAAGFFAAQANQAVAVFITFDIDVDFVAGFQGGVGAGADEFLNRHAAFGLEAHVDDGEVVVDGNDNAAQHAAFKAFVVAEGFTQQCFKIFGGSRHSGIGIGHEFRTFRYISGLPVGSGGLRLNTKSRGAPPYNDGDGRAFRSKSDRGKRLRSPQAT